MPRIRFLTVAGLLLAATMRAAPAPAKVDFARDIQPILANRCYDCHGLEKAKGGLRLTSRGHALKGGESGEPVLVAGQSARSPLIQRVTATDEDDVMPQKGDRLTAAQIDLLKRWIDEGAEWPENVRHWAYVKPVRPRVPVIGGAGSPSRPGLKVDSPPGTQAGSESRPHRNPIDAFIRARLAQEGLAPAPAADKPRWLRRVSLDLVGLPPTPGEIDAFLADTSAEAYERVVDRLLASPHYGERWARPWLDLARYADSHGFQRDDLRELWPYRDWVIRAMNDDMPFDQFTLWQNAGDLLATPDNLDPLIATGFHRAAATNVEAGTDQEEGRVNQVFDRVNTIGAVWLGMTLECAQCHNHKYDPITQQEYYQLFAFFNNTPKETDFTTPKAMAALKFTGPYLELPDPQKIAKQVALAAEVRRLDQQIAAERSRALKGRPEWEQRLAASATAAGEAHVLDVADFESTGGSVHRILPDKSVLLVDEAPDRDTYIVKVTTKLTGITGFKLEALTDPSLPGRGPGRGDAARPNFILNTFTVTAATAGRGPVPVRFAKATASFEQPRYGVANALKPTTDNRSGWAIGGQFFRDHWAIFQTAEPVGSAEGTKFTITLVQNFGAGRTIGRFRLSALTGAIPGEKSVPADILAMVRTPARERTPAQVNRLNDFFVAQDKSVQELQQRRAKLMQEQASLKGPQTLIMRELDEPRVAHVLKRGNFLDPGENVEPGTPAALHAMKVAPASSRHTANESDAGKMPALPNRLDFARWLVSRENPLMARVTVNRWWAEFFGRGIVATLEDFGAKGEPPTHPELLDWLAVEFMDHGWSMKHIHRLIALSATYRQSARVTPELLARDDQNVLLARGPRFRLDAETIRDNALSIAGLLSLKLGGPPVRPYQPPGLWENKVGGDRVTYEVSAGEDAYRRGIYTVWKRSSPYPSFMNFDAPARTACTVRRSRSNTPLQALTLLNDPVYVEAALALAQRVLAERPLATTEERIRHAFRLCLARAASETEMAALRGLFEQEKNAFTADPAAAREVGGKITAPPTRLSAMEKTAARSVAAETDAAELAAWHAVATALLNLDEMITK